MNTDNNKNGYLKHPIDEYNVSVKLLDEARLSAKLKEDVDMWQGHLEKMKVVQNQVKQNYDDFLAYQARELAAFTE